MRFASKYGHLVVQIQREIVEAYATGTSRVLQPNVWAEFKPEGLQPFERELVLEHWQFQGLYQEADEATTVQPDYRIGVFDSELAQQQSAWSDDTRLMVEKGLIDLAHFDYVLTLPRTVIPPPWPKYDEFVGTVEELIVKLKEDGHDLEAVLEYELAMQNRAPLVQALEEEINGIPSEEEILA